MRLFVALTPPAEVCAELLRATTALHALAADLRWAPPEQWHITLAFLAEVGDRERYALTIRLGRVAARHPPLRLAFAGGGRFGDRVLWTRVGGDRDGLRRLAASASAAARRSGLPVEDRPYRPHLTLARARTPTDLRPLIERLAGFTGPAWTADELHLVRSHLAAGPGGASRYERVASWPLGS